MASRFTAAVVQDCPAVFDREATLDKIARLTKAAAEKNASLIVFPDAFVSAYPKGLDFGARVGQRRSEGRDAFRQYYESSIDVPGPATDMIGRAAKAAGAHLVIGVIERDGGTLYCTVLF
ncbi:MAG: nitrilase-related carbon-nitrogen hydrolase, partial [Pseudomonadota bacterium]|nr:nitrilase-related carbon-nitrogen hydrolase [Pseudomonadota bacterium]